MTTMIKWNTGHSAINPIVPYLRNFMKYRADTGEGAQEAADYEEARIKGYILALEACSGEETAAIIMRESWKRARSQEMTE